MNPKQKAGIIIDLKFEFRYFCIDLSKSVHMPVITKKEAIKNGVYKTLDLFSSESTGDSIPMT
jgi:hypothetical protein